jgi:hypothetical protein
MTRVSIVCAGIVLSSTLAAAQGLPEVDDLKAPSTAAAVLLGTSPTSIERPDNPRAVIISLVSNVATSGGVPTNYSFGLTPYWMRWHPQLTFDSYARPTFSQRLARTLNVSLASADWTKGTGPAKQDLGSRVALGFSTIAYEGAMGPNLFTLKKNLEETLQALGNALLNRDRNPMLVAMRARRKDLAAKITQATKPEEVEAAWRALNDADQALKVLTAVADTRVTTLQAKRRMLATQIREIDTQRYGGRLGVSGAWSWSVPNDVLSDVTRNGYAIWVTPSYRWKLSKTKDTTDEDDVVVDENDLGVEQPDTSEELSTASGVDPGVIELVGVGRRLRESHAVTQETTNGWDVGARLIWQISGDLAMSGEFVKRLWRSDVNADTQRAVMLVEARLGKAAYVFASFGRDYTETGERTSLVSLVGIKIGVGSKPLLTNVAE